MRDYIRTLSEDSFNLLHEEVKHYILRKELPYISIVKETMRKFPDESVESIFMAICEEALRRLHDN